MRIYSHFRDYYDGVQSYQENDIKYVRETKELEKSPKSTLELAECAPRLDKASWVIIGFCGKFYLLYRASIEKKRWVKDYRGKSQLSSLSEEVILYSREEVLRFRAASEVRERKSGWRPTGLSFMDSYWRGSFWKSSEQQYDEALRLLKAKEGPDLFRELDAPVFVVEQCSHGIKTTVNPLLREYEFSRVVDPYQAFQELEMFVSSDLAKQVDPIVPISDELKAETHGFDRRWSFRKPGKNSK